MSVRSLYFLSLDRLASLLRYRYKDLTVFAISKVGFFAVFAFRERVLAGFPIYFANTAVVLGGGVVLGTELAAR